MESRASRDLTSENVAHIVSSSCEISHIIFGYFATSPIVASRWQVVSNVTKRSQQLLQSCTVATIGALERMRREQTSPEQHATRCHYFLQASCSLEFMKLHRKISSTNLHLLSSSSSLIQATQTPALGKCAVSQKLASSLHQLRQVLQHVHNLVTLLHSMCLGVSATERSDDWTFIRPTFIHLVYKSLSCFVKIFLNQWRLVLKFIHSSY